MGITIRKTRAKLHLNTSWTLNLLLNAFITAHHNGKLAKTNTNWIHLHSLQQAYFSMRRTSRIPRNVSRVTVFHCEIYDPQITPILRFPSLWTAYFQLRVFRFPQRSTHVSVLMGCDTSSLGDRRPTFRDRVGVSSLKLKKSRTSISKFRAKITPWRDATFLKNTALYSICLDSERHEQEFESV
jgi:hypothetical protein